MDLLIEFTPEERRVGEDARARRVLTIEVIARCRGIYDPVVVAPDGTGLMKPQREIGNG